MSEARIEEKFTPKEMWRLFHRANNGWGIENYDLPRSHFDYKQHAEDEVHLSQAIGKTKRPRQGEVKKDAKRGDFLQEVLKQSAATPPPWMYDIATKLTKSPHREEVPPRKAQSLCFKWKNVPKEQQNFERQEKSKGGKINMDAKKNTYIDQIIRNHSKENFPRPSPGQYFMDEKTIKQFAPDHEDLLATHAKKEERKNVLP